LIFRVCLPAFLAICKYFSRLVKWAACKNWSFCPPAANQGGGIKRHAFVGLARTIHVYVYTVYIRYSKQRNHHTYSHIRCAYTVLANPMYLWRVSSVLFSYLQINLSSACKADLTIPWPPTLRCVLACSSDQATFTDVVAVQPAAQPEATTAVAEVSVATIWLCVCCFFPVVEVARCSARSHYSRGRGERRGNRLAVCSAVLFPVVEVARCSARSHYSRGRGERGNHLAVFFFPVVEVARCSARSHYSRGRGERRGNRLAVCSFFFLLLR